MPPFIVISEGHDKQINKNTDIKGAWNLQDTVYPFGAKYVRLSKRVQRLDDDLCAGNFPNIGHRSDGQLNNIHFRLDVAVPWTAEDCAVQSNWLRWYTRKSHEAV